MSVALDSGQASALEACVADGGVAVIPTDTVYGVCCDPDNERAAEALYRLKRRSPARACAVMFFAVDAALRALAELRPRERLAAALAARHLEIRALVLQRERHRTAACAHVEHARRRW